MDNYITCGPTPPDESCTGVSGDKGRIRLENRLWKEQLEEKFKHHKDIKFVVKDFPHDFGTYSEVCVTWFDDEGAKQALDVDHNLPSNWWMPALEKLADYDSAKACKA